MIYIKVNGNEEYSFYTAKDFESWFYMARDIESIQLLDGKFYTIKDVEDYKTLIIFDKNKLDNRKYYSDHVDFEVIKDVLSVTNIPFIPENKLHLYK